MVLSELGQALSQAQQWERTKSVWAEANRLTQILQKDKELHIQALLELAKALTETVWKKVEQPVNIIQDQGQQIEEVSLSQETKEMQELYKSQTKELWEEMEKVIDGIEDSEQKTEVLCELISMQIRAREWRKVEELIETVPDRIHQIENVF